MSCVIKAEIFEDKAYLLTADGRIWTVEIEYADQPIMRMIARVDHERIKRLMHPQLPLIT